MTTASTKRCLTIAACLTLVASQQTAWAQVRTDAPGPAPHGQSQRALENAEGLLKAAIKAFDGADFQRCRTLLLEAQKVAADSKLKARIFLYLGLSHAVLGATAAAKKAFAAALTHDPAVTLDARKFKRDLVTLFNSVRGQLTGELTVSLQEPRALVYIDGVKRGTAPLSTKLPVGSHWVEVRSADGKRVFSKRKVVVTPYGRARVVASLPQGKLAVQSRPAGAQVTIDGRVVGKTPLAAIPCSAGTHDITVYKPGYGRQVRQLHVEAGADKRVEIVLLRPSAATAAGQSQGRLWTWIAGGAAVASLGIGLALKLTANADYSDWERSCRGGEGGLCGDLKSGIEAKDLASYTLFGVGAALAGAAVTAYFLESPRRGERTASTRNKRVVMPLIGPAYAGARVSF